MRLDRLLAEEQVVRDITEMPAELNRAAKLASLGDRPLAVVTATEGNAAGWPGQAVRAGGWLNAVQQRADPNLQRGLAVMATYRSRSRGDGASQRTSVLGARELVTAWSASSTLRRALMATAAVAPEPAAAGTSALGSAQLPAA